MRKKLVWRLLDIIEYYGNSRSKTSGPVCIQSRLGTRPNRV